MIVPGLFPRETRAALSLTYDDGSPQHLDVVMPDLEALGLRGTFFVNTRQAPGSAWHTRGPEWRAAAARGHEIGNHTQHHPCGKHFTWIKPNFSLEAYSMGRMEAELVAAGRDLGEVVGPAAMRSYAYTCGEEFVGPDRTSYRPLANRLFPVSRGGGDKPADPMTVDFASVPSFCTRKDTTAQQLIAMIDRAIEQGQWLVLMIHGVEGGHAELNISRAIHRAACEHAVKRREEIWCDTFLSVAMHLRRATKREWGA